MSRVIILDLAVGRDLSVPAAADIVATARDAGVSAIRLVDGSAGQILDPGMVAGYLAARLPDVPRLGGGRTRRWAEYAQVLTGLWESFPAGALLADQAAGLFADDSLIWGIDHRGSFY